MLAILNAPDTAQFTAEMARELAAALAVVAPPIEDDPPPPLPVIADFPPHPPPHATLAPLRMGAATNRGSRPYQVKRGFFFPSKERKEIKGKRLWKKELKKMERVKKT